MTLRIVVTGGRNYTDEATVRWALNHLHERNSISLLIHGDASGADRLCGFWAMGNHVPCEPCGARWSDIEAPGAVIRYRRDGTPYNVLAGFQRNQEMIDLHQPNYGVAFPGGSGTADMVGRINRAMIPLWDLRAR